MHKLRNTIVVIALAASAVNINGQTTPSTTAPTTRPAITADMSNTEVIDLWPAGAIELPAVDPETITEKTDPAGFRDRSIRHIAKPQLTRFAPNSTDSPHIAVILIPGGGYGGEVVDREGFFPAERLRAAGFEPFVLKYRLPTGVAPAPDAAPLPLMDVRQAVRLIRANAAKWAVDPNRIGVMGFSAGGHVAGMAATQFDAGDPNAADAVARVSSRPDFAVLMYAVSTMDAANAHAGSRKALLGENPDQAEVDRFSTAKRITPATPPLMLVHAKDDKVVKIINSEEVAAAAKAVGVSCNFIRFETGGHGFGVARPGTEPDGWMNRFFDWVKALPSAVSNGK